MRNWSKTARNQGTMVIYLLAGTKLLFLDIFVVTLKYFCSYGVLKSLFCKKMLKIRILKAQNVREYGI